METIRIRIIRESKKRQQDIFIGKGGIEDKTYVAANP